MGHLTVFSAVYLIVACMIPILGYIALQLDPKGLINRLFMITSLCLTLWALGFAVMMIAPDEGMAVLFMRVSAVGYSLIYSLFLHFVLAITGHKKLLGKKWFLALLYLPAAVCLYAFAFSPSITQSLYLMEHTARGWSRTTDSVLIDHIFNIYYIVAVRGGALV